MLLHVAGALVGFALVYCLDLSMCGHCSCLPVFFCICVTLGGWWELGNYCNSFPPPPNLVIRYVSNDKEKKAQFGFRKSRSTCDAIFILKNVIQKHTGPLVLIFVDLTAAYDHIPREFLFRVLEFRTGAKILTYILRKLYDGTKAYISGTQTTFDILIGCRQGGLESLHCLITILILF